MTRQFDWLKGNEKLKTWCDTCKEKTESKNDKGMVRCEECMHLKGVRTE